MHEYCDLPQAAAFAEGGNRYVDHLQRARLVAPKDIFARADLVRQRNSQIEKHKVSIDFCLANRSISQFTKNFSQVSFADMFTNYMSQTKYLRLNLHYTNLDGFAARGNIAKTVQQLNLILYSRKVTVYFTYINTVIDCIGTTTAESLHNLDIQLRLN